MEASVLDLRKKMRKVMSAIDRREQVTLTYRGKRRAVIVPLPESRKKQVRVADLPAFGMWAGRDDMADPVAYVENLRKPRSR
ncbi:MAG: prevent-host-death family protein [Lentisphaeria bacterium]|jgi:antitoxin (DNA-binding transcriptional repressor) of toxin-antitoxin stability system|nr:prevent-host-death family protein [Lentisphaeria bacterium]